MKIDNLNDDEKFALKVLKISAVVLVFLSALMIALSVCAEPISETEEYKTIQHNSQFHIISPSPCGRVEASFHSAKVERGMAENKEPVFGVEAQVEWHGVSVGGCGCWDATNENERRGKVNERCVFAGYERDICEHLTAGVGYTYKKAVDDSTHEVSGRVSAPFDVATPYAECVCDVCACEGACYCVVGACRCFRPCECVEIECDCGMGCGNTRRNRADFERDACGLRDIRVGVSVNYQVLKHFSICPFCRVHQNLTKMAREEYNNGLVLDAGIALVSEF